VIGRSVGTYLSLAKLWDIKGDDLASLVASILKNNILALTTDKQYMSISLLICSSNSTQEWSCHRVISHDWVHMHNPRMPRIY
jgi:hypothetical protein